MFLTEFGRTPKINKDGGRDHWGAGGSIFFAGGGTQVGTGHRRHRPPGRLSRRPAANTPADIAATIYHFLDIDPGHLLHDRHNRPHFVLPEGEVIGEVV